MCEKCDEMVRLLGLTEDGKSWVEVTGTAPPRLVTREEEK